MSSMCNVGDHWGRGFKTFKAKIMEIHIFNFVPIITVGGNCLQGFLLHNRSPILWISLGQTCVILSELGSFCQVMLHVNISNKIIGS